MYELTNLRIYESRNKMPNIQPIQPKFHLAVLNAEQLAAKLEREAAQRRRPVRRLPRG